MSTAGVVVSRPGFAQILSQLCNEHEHEVGELRAEVERLQNIAHQGIGSTQTSDAEIDTAPANAPAEMGEMSPAPTKTTNQSHSLHSADGQHEERPSRKSIFDTPQSTSKFSQDDQEDGAMICKGRFDLFIALIIAASVLVLFLKMECDGRRNGSELADVIAGLSPSTIYDTPQVEDVIFDVFNHIFNFFFTLELLIRFYYLRIAYVWSNGRCQKFNIFDIFLVLTALLDSYILRFASLSNVEILRVLRILKVFRCLRVVRTLRAFESLRILVNTVFASFWALHWSMVLLFLVMLMMSMVLCQTLAMTILDPGLDTVTRQWIYTYYGTSTRSLYTVFEFTFSGCWPGYARKLIEEVSALYSIIFGLYITFVVFAMFRIITALFLKDTLAVANSDATQQIQNTMKEKQRYAERLLEFFEEADVSGDGEITLSEFEAILAEPRAAAFLKTLELDPNEGVMLFQLLDDGNGSVSSEEFVKSAVKLKGTARSQDVISILHEIKHLRRSMEQAGSARASVSRRKSGHEHQQRQTKGSTMAQAV